MVQCLKPRPYIVGYVFEHPHKLQSSIISDHAYDFWRHHDQLHLVDHLDAALKLAEINRMTFVAYLIKMAKEAAVRPKTEGRRAA